MKNRKRKKLNKEEIIKKWKESGLLDGLESSKMLDDNHPLVRLLKARNNI